MKSGLSVIKIFLSYLSSLIVFKLEDIKWVSVGLIHNLLNKLNESILCEPLSECRFNTQFIEQAKWKYIMRASGEDNIILFNWFNKLVMNMHIINILFITYRPKENRSFFTEPIMFSALLTLCLYSTNDVTSKFYYTSVISFLLNGFITLLRRVLCDENW